MITHSLRKSLCNSRKKYILWISRILIVLLSFGQSGFSVDSTSSLKVLDSFYLSDAVILVSVISMFYAYFAIRKNYHKGLSSFIER